jgi:hypothetical protein
MSITETPEYDAGWAWAKEYGPELAELFSGKEIATQELRSRLFREASRRWPSVQDNMDNDLKQTAFVAGGFKSAAETIKFTQEGAAAVFEAALEMGVIWSSEQAKVRALAELKAKPLGWWRRKMGHAKPLDVVNALSVAWRYNWAKERGRPHPGSKWAVLIDTLGSREIVILSEATQILSQVNGLPTYTVDSPEESFQIISRSVYEGGVLYRYAGEIVG